MPQLAPLPDHLKNRLIAAGVKDEPTLYAALEADPQLFDDYHRWLFTEAVHAFAQAKDREALLALTKEVPLILGDDFIKAVKKAINKALDVGDYDTAEALRQRLDVLTEIRAMKAYQRQTPLAQAVIAFVQARSDIAARRVFEQYRAELDADEAERFLAEEFEGSSEEAEHHLAQRRELLRTLRTETQG